MSTSLLRIGTGAAFSGDRIDPALALAEQGNLDYLVFECLAERTIALAQLRKRKDASKGYDPLLERRMEMLLPLLKQKRFKVITNMGAANPIAAGEAIVAIAERLGIAVKVAVVTGDDVLDRLDPMSPTLETGHPVSLVGPLVSANAYLGAAALMPALETGADIIISGRVADPSLFLAPIVHHYGWSLDDFERVARGTMIGHLLECAGQLCGGYYADPGPKDIPDLAEIGFPYADIDRDGRAVFGKLPNTGGAITRATVTEQLLYEVMDPARYLTPDVIADFSAVSLSVLERDRVEATGATASARPTQLKVSVGYLAGYVGEGEISYAGTNALTRARLAGEIVEKRLRRLFTEVRVDVIGSTSCHGRSFDADEKPYEVRLRVAARAASAEAAMVVGEEVEALYTNGPAGGGGVRKYAQEQVGVVSTLIDRNRAKAEVTVKETRTYAEAL